MLKLEALKDKQNRYILRSICEKLLTFDEVSDKYSSLDINSANVFCPFHNVSEGLGPNDSTPAAKVYYNEVKQIYVIHCFTSHKNYTVADLIEKVLKRDLYEFLVEKKSEQEILTLYDSIVKGYIEIEDDSYEQRINYISNLFLECNCSTVEFIENLYNP